MSDIEIPEPVDLIAAKLEEVSGTSPKLARRWAIQVVEALSAAGYVVEYLDRAELKPDITPPGFGRIPPGRREVKVEDVL